MTEPIYLTDNAREAAWHILNNTQLGATITRLGHYEDDRRCLTITLDANAVGSLSTGERALWDVLRSLQSFGPAVSLDNLARSLDPDAQSAFVAAMALAFGWGVGMAVAS